MALAFAAANISPESGGPGAASSSAESLEAQEIRVSKAYENALQLIHRGCTEEAQVILKRLLQEPILQLDTTDGSDRAVTTTFPYQLRFVVIKNLAAILASAGHEDQCGALELFHEALTMEPGDIVIWNRMGSLAAEMGRLAESRAIFERALQHNARHPLLLENLMSVQMQLGDWDAAEYTAKKLLMKDVRNPNAAAVSNFLAQRSAGNAADHSDEPPNEPLAWQKLSRLAFPAETLHKRPDNMLRTIEIESATWESLVQSLLSFFLPKRSPSTTELPCVCQDVELTLRGPLPVSFKEQETIVQPTGIRNLRAAGLPMAVTISDGGKADEAPQSPAEGVRQSQNVDGNGIIVRSTDSEESLGTPPQDPCGNAGPGSARGPGASLGLVLPRNTLEEMTRSPREDLVDGAPQAITGIPLSQSGAQQKQHDASAVDHTLLSPSGRSKGRGRMQSGKEAVQPQRLSQRLRKDSGQESNMNQDKRESTDIADLVPFLGPKPSPTEQGIPLMGAQQGVTVCEGLPNSPHGDHDEAAEVQNFILQYSGRGGIPYVASALLECLTRRPERRLPAGVCDALLKLEAPLRGWPRSGECAMFLAELHGDRAIQRSKGKEGSDSPSQPTSVGTHCASPSKSTPAQRAKSAEKPRKIQPIDRPIAHYKAATANLGLVMNALLCEVEGIPSGDEIHSEEALHKLALRYHWALGCAKEHRDQLTEALEHFQRCLELCRLCGGSGTCPTAEANELSPLPRIASAAAVPKPAATRGNTTQPASESTSKAAEFVEAEMNHDGNEALCNARSTAGLRSSSPARDDIDRSVASAPNPSPLFTARQATPGAAAHLLEDRPPRAVGSSMPDVCSAAQSGVSCRTSNGHSHVVAPSLEHMDIDPGYGQHRLGSVEGSHRQTSVGVHLVNCQENKLITAKMVQTKLEGLEVLRLLASARKLMEDGNAEDVVKRLEALVGIGEATEGLSCLSHNPRAYLQALSLLQDAASAAGNNFVEVQLRARLLWLQQCLPLLHNTDLTNSEMLSGTRDMSSRSDASGSPLRPVVVKAIWGLVAFLEELLPEINSEAGLPAVLANVQQNLHSLLWQLYLQVQQCYAALDHGVNRGSTQRSLNVKETSRQNALLAAVLCLCVVRKVDESVPQDAATEIAVLTAAAGILAERGALLLRRGAFVRMVLLHLTHHLEHLDKRNGDENTSEQRGQGTPAGCEDDDDVRQQLDGVVAQCLYLLYGVDLPHRDNSWGSGLQEMRVGTRMLGSRADCLEVWNYLRPYAMALVQDVALVQDKNKLKRLQRLQGILRQMLHVFPEPPEAVSAAWDPLAVLDSNTFDPDSLLHDDDHSAVEELIGAPPSLGVEVEADPDSRVHSALYLLELLLQPVISERTGAKGSWLGELPEPILDDISRWAQYALLYEPNNYMVWKIVATMYREALQSMLEEAALTLSVKEWEAHPYAKQRSKVYLERGLRATWIARSLAPDDHLYELEEQLGMMYYEALQGALPTLNLGPHNTGKRKEQAWYKAYSQLAREAFQRAAALLPDEWQYQLYLGKFRRKHGMPSSKVLMCFAKACHYSIVYSGGKLEAIYQLHAKRMKYITDDPKDLEGASMYCFSPSTMDRLDRILNTATSAEGLPYTGILEPGNTPLERVTNPVHSSPSAKLFARVSSQEIQELLLQDALEAMRWCLEKDRHFHKARYRLAKGLQAAGQVEEAMQAMRFLFIIPQSRKLFTTKNVWIIQDQERKVKGGRESSAEDAAPARAAMEDARTWGLPPTNIQGTGLMEGERKYIASLRKYIIFYTDLLVECEDLDTLQAAAQFMRNPDLWSHSNTVVDLAQLVMGKYVITLSAKLRTQAALLFSECAGPSLPSVGQKEVLKDMNAPPLGAALGRSTGPSGLTVQVERQITRVSADPLPLDQTNQALVDHPSQRQGQTIPGPHRSSPVVGQAGHRDLPFAGSDRAAEASPAVPDMGDQPQHSSSSPKTAGNIAVRHPGQWPPVREEVRLLLQKAYALYAEFSLMPDGTATWASVIQPAVVDQLRNVLQSSAGGKAVNGQTEGEHLGDTDADGTTAGHSRDLPGMWITEAAFSEYSRAYLGALAEIGDMDRLFGLLNVIKKRYKQIKLAPRASRRIAGDLGGAVFRAAEVAVGKLQQDAERSLQDPEPTPMEAAQPGQPQEGEEDLAGSQGTPAECLGTQETPTEGEEEEPLQELEKPEDNGEERQGGDEGERHTSRGPGRASRRELKGQAPSGAPAEERPSATGETVQCPREQAKERGFQVLRYLLQMCKPSTLPAPEGTTSLYRGASTAEVGNLLVCAFDAYMRLLHGPAANNREWSAAAAIAACEEAIRQTRRSATKAPIIPLPEKPVVAVVSEPSLPQAGLHWSENRSMQEAMHVQEGPQNGAEAGGIRQGFQAGVEHARISSVPLNHGVPSAAASANLSPQAPLPRAPTLSSASPGVSWPYPAGGLPYAAGFNLNSALSSLATAQLQNTGLSAVPPNPLGVAGNPAGLMGWDVAGYSAGTSMPLYPLHLQMQIRATANQWLGNGLLHPGVATPSPISSVMTGQSLFMPRPPAGQVGSLSSASLTGVPCTGAFQIPGQGPPRAAVTAAFSVPGDCGTLMPGGQPHGQTSLPGARNGAKRDASTNAGEDSQPPPKRPCI